MKIFTHRHRYIYIYSYSYGCRVIFVKYCRRCAAVVYKYCRCFRASAAAVAAGCLLLSHLEIVVALPLLLRLGWFPSFFWFCYCRSGSFPVAVLLLLSTSFDFFIYFFFLNRLVEVLYASAFLSVFFFFSCFVIIWKFWRQGSLRLLSKGVQRVELAFEHWSISKKGWACQSWRLTCPQVDRLGLDLAFFFG